MSSKFTPWVYCRRIAQKLSKNSQCTYWVNRGLSPVFDTLEQHIAGQDDQIKVILHRIVATEEGYCRYRESTPKVISSHCFNMITKLTEDVQETKVELETGGLETGGLEYEDEEVEAFRHSLIVRN